MLAGIGIEAERFAAIGTPPVRPGSAELVFHQRLRASALSPHQVRWGPAALKDEAASKGWPPLIWTRADGYQLGADRAEPEAYKRAVVSEKRLSSAGPSPAPPPLTRPLGGHHPHNQTHHTPNLRPKRTTGLRKAQRY